MRTRRFHSKGKTDHLFIEIVSNELYHLKNVLRKKRGDSIEVFNGKGSLFSGKIESINKSKAIVKITKEILKERPSTNIIIAPSLLKKKTMNLMIEKLTEMGVNKIQPVIFARTEAVYSNSLISKWEKLAIESLKVNGNLWVTDINPPCSVKELILSSSEIKNKILLDIEGEKAYFKGIGQFVCVIGPPGGFTSEERKLFTKSGFIPININESVMKVETAAFSTVSILKYLIR